MHCWVVWQQPTRPDCRSGKFARQGYHRCNSTEISWQLAMLKRLYCTDANPSLCGLSISGCKTYILSCSAANAQRILCKLLSHSFQTLMLGSLECRFSVELWTGHVHTKAYYTGRIGNCFNTAQTWMNLLCCCSLASGKPYIPRQVY